MVFLDMVDGVDEIVNATALRLFLGLARETQTAIGFDAALGVNP